MVNATLTRQVASATPAPPSRPRGRRFWFDPRFAIGVLLIVVSVIATVVVVTTADSSRPVLQARHALVPGDTVDADDFVVTSVDLADSTDRYLAPDALPTTGLVVTRTIAEGELAPRAALAEAASSDLRSVVLETSSALASGVVEGAAVDVWSADEREGGGFGPPRVLVPGAIVAGVDAADGVVVDSGSASVELLVPSDDVAAVLGAIANEASLSVVPSETLDGGH